MAQPPSFYGQQPNVGRMPMPIQTGAGVAEGVDALTRSIAGAAATERQIDEDNRQTHLIVDRVAEQRDLQLASGAAAAGIADLQGTLATDLIKLRETAQPGAAGHEDAVNERIAKFRSDAAALLGNKPELVANYADNIASIAANARTGEVTWSATQRATKTVADSDTLQNSLQSNLRTSVAAGTFNDKMLADADTLDSRAIDLLPIGGNAREQLKRTRHLERIVTVISARTDVDPKGVVADIDAGKYGELDDKVLAPLRSHAQVEAEQLDTKATQAVNAFDAQERAHARNLVEDVTAGTVGDTPTLVAMRAKFAMSDKPEDIALVHDLDGAIAKNATNAKFGESSQDERIGALRAIEAKKGWQSDNQLRIAHDQLQTLIGRDDHAADADPVSLYARQTTTALPAANLGDRAVMQQRFTIADQAAQRFHKPVPQVFTEDEAKQLRETYNGATVGGKADFLIGIGQYGSARARQMMNQLSPNKPELMRLAELSANRDPAVQALVREATDGSAIPLKDGAAALVRNQMQASFGPAIARLAGDRQRAIAQVATWIYAHRAAAAGKADRLDAGIAQQAIGAALGGAGGKGGIGSRNGAAVVLPMGATQHDFDTILAMGTARPEVVRGAANGVPMWNNRALHQREFAGLVPVLVHDDGVLAAYAFKSRGGSGFVKNERGQDYLLDIRKLAQGLRGKGVK